MMVVAASIIERRFERSPGNNNIVRYCIWLEIPLVIYSVPTGTSAQVPWLWGIHPGHKVSDTGAAGTFAVPVSFPLRNGIFHCGPINVAGSANRSSTLHIQENNNAHLQPQTHPQRRKDKKKKTNGYEREWSLTSDLNLAWGYHKLAEKRSNRDYYRSNSMQARIDPYTYLLYNRSVMSNSLRK